MFKDIIKSSSKARYTVVSNPELVIGLVGPIGLDLTGISNAVKTSLAGLGYQAYDIRVMSLIPDESVDTSIDESSYFHKYMSLINIGNEFRSKAGNASAIAGLAIVKIREIRTSINNNVDEPALGTAYVIRQFKRPEEIELMRRTYGRKFILISVFGGEKERRQNIISRIRQYDSSPKEDSDCEKQAIDLITNDFNQKDEVHGQRISDVFHLGDVFVDGINSDEAKPTIERFLRALFGDTCASPTKDEYGLYMASAAAYRSVDLSRQVGAAIFSYWTDDDEPKARDIEVGRDPNQGRKAEIVFDLLKRMKKSGFLCEEITRKDDDNAMFEEIFSNKSIEESQLMDIIEFGRIIHAEMSAISDASRLGRPTARSTLFCTTFPCHLCAKHIVAAGLDRVVFLEPYPKSYTQKLHSDSITFDKGNSDKVLFQPFLGISPRRYRDIFEKKKRKDSSGNAKEWYEGKPAPLIEDRSGAYIENESASIFASLEGLFSMSDTSSISVEAEADPSTVSVLPSESDGEK